MNDSAALIKTKVVPLQDLKVLCYGFANSFINPLPSNMKNSEYNE